MAATCRGRARLCITIRCPPTLSHFQRALPTLRKHLLQLRKRNGLKPLPLRAQEQTIHGPSCPANGTGNQACCDVPCGEYVFDHRNGSMLTQWMIEEFVGGEDGIDSPYIDGFCESHVLCLLASAAHKTWFRG